MVPPGGDSVRLLRDRLDMALDAQGRWSFVVVGAPALRGSQFRDGTAEEGLAATSYPLDGGRGGTHMHAFGSSRRRSDSFPLSANRQREDTV